MFIIMIQIFLKIKNKNPKIQKEKFILLFVGLVSIAKGVQHAIHVQKTS